MPCREDLVELVDLLGARVGVLVAEQPEQGRAQVRQLVDEVGDLEREALRGRADHERAVAVDRRVEIEVAGREHGLPSARAVADDPDLAVGAGQRSRYVAAPADVADQALIGHAALGPGGGGGIVGRRARRFAPVQVGADRVVAQLGEPADDLLGRRS